MNEVVKSKTPRAGEGEGLRVSPMEVSMLPTMRSSNNGKCLSLRSN